MAQLADPSRSDLLEPARQEARAAFAEGQSVAGGGVPRNCATERISHLVASLSDRIKGATPVLANSCASRSATSACPFGVQCAPSSI
jgi:hypothetical protein